MVKSAYGFLNNVYTYSDTISSLYTFNEFLSILEKNHESENELFSMRMADFEDEVIKAKYDVKFDINEYFDDYASDLF